MPGLVEGRGGLVVLTGPTGIGKTYLAHNVLADLPPSVLSAAAGPSGYLQTPVLWPVRQIARAMLRRGTDSARQEYTRLTRSCDDGDEPEFVLVERMADLLAALASGGPVAALLDDVDRVDPLSIAVVEALSERVAHCPLLLLVCARTGEGTDPAVTRVLGRLRGRPRLLTLPLTGLAEDDVDRLIGVTRPEIDVEDRREIARVSAGNPLLAQELAHVWAAQQRILEFGGPEPALPASATLRELVADRLAAVDADEVLAPLAVLGRPATLSLLAEACAVPVPVVLRVVERAAAVGLVAVEGRLGAVRMAHAVFGDVMLQRLDPERLRRIHLRLASLFDRAPDLPGPHHVQRARHLIAAGEDAEVTADACLVAALYEESAGGLRAALELVTYGLDNCVSGQQTRVRLLRLRGRCLIRTGQLGQARQQLLRAVQTARLGGDAELFAAAVLDLTAVDDAGSGDDDAGCGPDGDTPLCLLQEALGATGEALAATGGAQPAPTRARLLARLSGLLQLCDPPRSRQLADEARTAAGADPKAQREAHEAWAVTSGGIHHLHEVEAVRALLTAQGHVPRADALSVFLTPALVGGDRTALEHYLARISADVELRSASRARGLLAMARLGVAVADADARSVVALVAEGVRSGIADVRMLAVLLQVLWHFHTGTGSPGTGLPDVASAPSAELADLLAVTKAATLALRADPAARTWLRSRFGEGQVLPQPGPGPAQDLTWAVTALAGHVQADEAACSGALAHFAGHAGAFVTFSTALVGPVGWFTAAAHQTLGEISQALRANEQALDLSRRFTSPTWTAQCLVQRARLLAPTDAERAVVLATEAATLAQDRQLTAIADQAGHEVASLRTPAHLLDDRQRELLRLAGVGLRNDQIAARLYVSTATVERHLSQIYRTLGVANRAAATRWLALQVPSGARDPRETSPRPPEPGATGGRRGPVRGSRRPSGPSAAGPSSPSSSTASG